MLTASNPLKVLAFTAACLIGLMASRAWAGVLVQYDFEGETESPVGQWTVTDKAGPPNTNTTALSSLGQSLASFNGSTALSMSGSTSGLVLGAGGELDQNYSNGLVIEAIFQITGGLGVTTKTIAARYITSGGNRSFILEVLNDATAAPRQTRFIVSSNGGSGGGSNSVISNLVIEENKTYALRAVFDPSKDLLSLAIENMDDKVSDIVSTTTLFDSIFVGTAPTVIGAAGNGTGNEFEGFIDNVTIYNPEPTTAVLLAAPMLGLLRRRRA